MNIHTQKVWSTSRRYTQEDRHFDRCQYANQKWCIAHNCLRHTRPAKTNTYYANNHKYSTLSKRPSSKCHIPSRLRFSGSTNRSNSISFIASNTSWPEIVFRLCCIAKLLALTMQKTGTYSTRWLSCMKCPQYSIGLEAIAPKICQGQPPTMYSECSRFHPNQFDLGRVIAEHVNSAKLLHRVNLIFCGRLASSRIIKVIDSESKIWCWRLK